MALGRLSILKSALHLNVAANTWDDELMLLLIKATETINGMTNRELEQKTYEDEYYTPIQANRILLNHYPVQSLVSVKFWDSSSEAWTAESLSYFELINKRYICYPKRGQESNSTYSGFPVGERNSVSITHASGYNTAGWNSLSITAAFGVPADLEWITCGIASIDWSLGREDKSLLGIVSRSFGAESVTYENYERGVYPDKIMAVIDRYRGIPVIA